ncbi:MAG: outer membrane protein assembly factor BamA, partial [Candidatus Methylopumilus sp.]|nr:outer membrane protein assembly factor BamA [Candidatus Methylopumilus sp.]
EISAPGLDIQMYKIILQENWFKEINQSMTLMLGGQLGYGDSYGGKEFPFYKNFYVGGVSTVRGYAQGAIGPHSKATDGSIMFVGGNKEIIGNAELLLPMPFMRNNKQFRLSAFIDAGNVFSSDQSFSLSDLRYSVGMGVVWVSPFGPLKLVYAKPFNEGTNDKTESIQFQMGQQF